MAAFDLAERLCGLDVHVWVLSLDTSAFFERELSRTLSADEKDRAANFGAEVLKRRFCVSRGLLRILLGMYLGTHPRDIKFSYGKYGKPSVSGRDRFHFNLAHSEDVAVYGFALGYELGIDLERIRDIPDTDAIARHFFSSGEVADLESVEPSGRLSSFFACWTRKEAYIKAIGQGLSAPLDKFSVTLRPDETPRFKCIDGEIAEAQSWSLYSFRPNEEHIGALAFRGRRNLRCSLFQPIEQVLANAAAPHSFIGNCLDDSLS